MTVVSMGNPEGELDVVGMILRGGDRPVRSREAP